MMGSPVKVWTYSNDFAFSSSSSSGVSLETAPAGKLVAGTAEP